jgi:hypothetical protein
MRSKLAAAVLSGVICLLAGFIPAGQAADQPKAKMTYLDHVAPLFRSRCGSCHNPDKQKGGLNLDNYGSAMQGGGSGKVVEPGDPDGSTLLQVIMHKEEPKMPPKSPKIPDAEIDVIRKWIEGGALENSGSVATAKAKPKFEFKLDPAAMGKPAGQPAMPENLSTEPFVPQAKPGAVVAMAASPWAPLVAIAGHRQVLLYRATDDHLMGVLPFPEGLIYTLKFSRNGDLLLAGGGRGGQSGLAVAWDVKKGTRVFEVGKEYDIVLAADISPDHGMVALGGPSKVVRVYNTADGSLAFEMRKHTEWITAIEFSPDGALLATGDRNNGLLVWEAQTGREFHDLKGHTAFITDLSWRLDSNVLASSSEDTTVKLWEMENGGNIKNIGAHGGGAISVRFTKDGRLVTAGRDRVVRLWDGNGNKQRDFEAFNDLAIRAVTTFDDSKVIGADFSGEVRVWDAKEGRRLASLAVNPAPIAVRLEQTNRLLAAAQAEADSLAKQMAPFQAAANAAPGLLAQAQGKVTAADQALGKQNAAIQQVDQAFKTKLAAAVEARGTLQAAEQLAAQTASAHSAADAAANQSIQAEKAATDALNAAKTAAEKAVAAKTAHDPALLAAAKALGAAETPDAAAKAAEALTQEAQKAVELIQAVAATGARVSTARQELARIAATKAAAPQAAANARLVARAASLAVPSAREAVARADQEKAVAEKALADARGTVPALTNQLAAAKKELEQTTAAKVAAEKAVVERRAPLDAALTKVKALKAEADALAVEKQRSDAGRDGLASADKPGS